MEAATLGWSSAPLSGWAVSGVEMLSSWIRPLQWILPVGAVISWQGRVLRVRGSWGSPLTGLTDTRGTVHVSCFSWEDTSPS